QQPFVTAFLVWIKEIATDPPTRLLAKTIMESGFIRITDKEGKVWTIAHAKMFDHRNILEAIRCRREWNFQIRERLVNTYLHFIKWLSKVTHGFVPLLEDPDLCRSQDRSLAFLNFIHFLSKLREEDQLVAKLLYFGGSRSLGEILAL